MVLNLCLPHFQTSIQCNKLCADGHDVSNLLSGDPHARRRGFKLEYFLRPPVHVTLSFQVKMELCRLDLELWPWGADQGRCSRRMEILVCSERDGENFQLVSRCDLQDELEVCFVHPAFRPRAPFADPPPQPPTLPTEFWSRGSLGSVARLRISIPYSGAASALGIKSLAVWALPSRSCPASEFQKIQEAHLNALKPNPPISVPPKPSHPALTDSPIPEEFLDPLTQELMAFPMILPSGMVIDLGTLEEYQKREATWGRLPNDPFTGVPFTPSSKPLPNPLLKSRIDRLVLQTGSTGVGNRNNLMNKPLPSRLTLKEAKSDTEHSRIQSGCDSGSSKNLNDAYASQEQSRIYPGSITGSSSNSDTSQEHSKINSRSVTGSSRNSYDTDTSQEHSRNQSKSKSGTTHSRSSKRKHDSGFPSTSTDPDRSPPRKTHQTPSDSHEQRLADSLDQALNAALHGLPVFTSQNQSTSCVNASAGQHMCVFCSCSLTVYSSSVPSYSLPCDHLICGPCLRQKHQTDSDRLKIKCPACGLSASSRDVTRVHH